MKIFRPVRYNVTFRISFFSKNKDGKTERKAITIVETTRQEIDTLIKEVFKDNLERLDEKPRDFVKLTVQIIKFKKGEPRGKDEWSYRLYRASVDDIQRLIDAVDYQNIEDENINGKFI